MKTTLAIDTATARTQFALLKGSELLWLQIEDGATTHGDVLAKFGALAAKENIDQVIVGMGPGPFTGLRVGIVFSQTFAKARNIPWLGVCSLDGILVSENDYIVATDARRKELYWAHYKDGKRYSGPNVTSADKLPEIKTYYQFPDLTSFLKLDQVSQPMYLRHPDAIPIAERK